MEILLTLRLDVGLITKSTFNSSCNCRSKFQRIATLTKETSATFNMALETLIGQFKKVQHLAMEQAQIKIQVDQVYILNILIQ